MVEIKLAISFLFFAAALGALLTMLHNMGRSEKKASPESLIRTHRTFGIIFAFLLLVLALIGAGFVSVLGDGMSLRAVFHMVTALTLIAVVILKILIAQFYRGLLRFAPAMGLIIFVLVFVVFAISAGFDLATEVGPVWPEILNDPELHRSGHSAVGTSAVRTGEAEPMSALGAGTSDASAAGSEHKGATEAGRAIFVRKCAGCHYPESRKRLIGPGLAGLTKGEALPVSGRPPTSGNIHEQIVNPIGTMPSFASLTDAEISDLLAYLGTL